MERPKPALQKEKITKHRQEIMEQLLQIKNRVSGFGSFLPNLVNYLQMLCHTFKAGQVAAYFAAWRTLTNDKILLSDVLGAGIECTALPVQHRLPNQIFSEHECPIVRQEVHISCLRNVSSQKCHLYLDKSCLMYSFVSRRMGLIDLY